MINLSSTNIPHNSNKKYNIENEFNGQLAVFYCPQMRWLCYKSIRFSGSWASKLHVIGYE